jgi:hypothetical protein
MQISRYLKVPLLDRAVQQSSIEWLDAISNHDHMRNLDKPIQNMNANRWRKEMDPHEITTFETIAGDALLMAGYGTSLPRQLPLARRNKAMKLAAAYVRRFFSPVEWTRYVLRLLPFALSLSGAIGFSLPTMLRKLRLRG